MLREQGVSWGWIPPLPMPKPPSSWPLPWAEFLTLAVSDHTIVVTQVIKIFFLYTSSVYLCHLFLISSASVRSILVFLFVTVPVFAEKFPLVSLIFLKRSLVFLILLFSSTSFHWSLRKAFWSLLAILWNSAFSWIYLSFTPLDLASLLFSAICKASSDNHYAFFFGMVLFTASCTVLWTSIHSSSGTLSDLVSWIYLSFPLYNHKLFDLGHLGNLNGLVVFPVFFNLSLNFPIGSSWSEPQAAPSLVFAYCIEFLHLQLQRI